MCTHTHPHLIIIILAEKGKVRDQLWPNPRMHCTSVSATSISFFPLAGETHWGFPRRHHYFSLCPVSCGVSNTEEILMSYWGKKQWQYFLCWLSPILSCEGLVVHHSATEDTEAAKWFILSTSLHFPCPLAEQCFIWKEMHQWLAVWCHWSELKGPHFNHYWWHCICAVLTMLFHNHVVPPWEKKRNLVKRS